MATVENVLKEAVVMEGVLPGVAVPAASTVAPAVAGVGLACVAVKGVKALKEAYNNRAPPQSSTAESSAPTLDTDKHQVLSEPAFWSGQDQVVLNDELRAAAVKLPKLDPVSFTPQLESLSARSHERSSSIGVSASFSTRIGNQEVKLPWQLAAAAFVGRVLYKAFSSSNPPSSPTEERASVPDEEYLKPGLYAAAQVPPSPPSSDDDESGPDDDGPESSSFRDRPILISKKRMKDILDSYGEDMHKKLKQKMGVNLKNPKVWSNVDFRIDQGARNTQAATRRTWNLQINREAKDPWARTMLKQKKTTHLKLFWDDFDWKSPPSFEAWKKGILERFGK